MTCFTENNADLLIAYFEHTLPADERAAVEAHAAKCADCGGLLAAHALMSEAPAPVVSTDFDARLYARIREDQAKPWYVGMWHFSHWKFAIPVAAVAAMLAVGVFLSQPQPAIDTQTKAESIDVQQLEQALDDLELLTPLAEASNI
jgi:anti-sigma factor RsiW